MMAALDLAQQAATAGEVPVGSVVLDAHGRLVGQGYNRTIGNHDPSAHAEIMALRDAGSRTGNYRLPGASLFVTLEPCLMCMGAILHARIERVVYGAIDPKTGACESILKVQDLRQINHQTRVEGGLMAEECGTVLREFFRERRLRRKQERSHNCGIVRGEPDSRSMSFATGGPMHNDTHLLIIDPQNDFCDLPASYLPTNPLNNDHRLKPGLPVPGAHADMHRLAHFIRSGKDAIDHITITLDSHHHVGIERPAMWRQKDGAAVAPFTQILAADVREGRYSPQNPEAQDTVLAYLDALEAAGRYTHMVWPAHCEIGTWGHNVHADILAACNVWEEYSGLPTTKVLKGSNPYTEHYSALMAEVPDANDPATQLNERLLEMLRSSGTVLVAGEAGSHCVKATLEHYVYYAGPEALTRVVLLTDCMSPIPGFEEPYQTFLETMEGQGARLMMAAAWLTDQRSRASA